jgi:hypothetical protein
MANREDSVRNQGGVNGQHVCTLPTVVRSTVTSGFLGFETLFTVWYSKEQNVPETGSVSVLR